MIKFKSTRGSDCEKTGAQAIIAGLAEDKGLYAPTEFPVLPFGLEEIASKSYKEVAWAILSSFFTDYTAEEMKHCVDGAYTDKFEAEDVVPVVKAGDAYFLELYYGRTAAFKDMALSILPYLLTTAIKKEKEEAKICILAATSGDTGKAALEGFADVSGTEIVVFFPDKGVSTVQKTQMITQEGANTHVFAIEGNFDDAQTGVKSIFNDDDFAAKLTSKGCKLSSANSINIGRLVPQVAYYVYGYAKLIEQGAIKEGDKINIVVPTGNFGNILAAYYAMKMGIPVNKFICASNENNVLTDFIKTGKYDIHRDFFITNSPSMDILISSNLERLLYELSGKDGAEVKGMMDALSKDKEYKISDKIKEGMADFYGGYCGTEETENAIKAMLDKNNYLMDTHTAVAYRVYENYRKETGDNTVSLIASTASAYKFAESVSRAIGLPASENEFRAIEAVNEATGVRIPNNLKGLEDKPVRYKTVISVAEMPEAVYGAIAK